MKRVLLLNPPADPPVSRDYYCGHFVKGRYYWPQLDLLVMSGQLSSEFDVQVLDAVVEGLSLDDTYARIGELSPDAVVAVTSSVSWTEDMAFLSEVRQKQSVSVLISGDHARAEPEAVLHQNSFVDAVILDFTDNDACKFLAGESGLGLRNVYTRSDSGAPRMEGDGRISYPAPRYDLFSLKRYHMPQSLHHPSVPILTDFGCPFSCDFCFMERVNHRLRDVGNVVEELTRLRERGIRELFLADQSFGSNGPHAREVCEAIREVGGGRFTWAASMRVDAADPELLGIMKKAGCHTLMFGVETLSQEVLDAHRKRTTVDGIESAFALARKMGFRTLAHFIIGLTGEDEDSLQRLADFAISLDPDMASFNIAEPVEEQSGLSRSRILQIRDEAVRRFYMRPRYILGQLARVRSTYQLRTLFREGTSMIRSRMSS